MASYLISDPSIVLYHNARVLSVPRTHSQADAIIHSIRNSDFDAAARRIDHLTALKQGNLPEGLELKNNALYFRGTRLYNALVTRILKMQEEGFELTPMLRFLHNLMENPSRRAVNELYTFLEKSDLPITEDGHFLAYKRVRDDYLDCYSGTIRNQIGDRPSMPRNEVDDDCEISCSAGLHFASLGYLRHFEGTRLMVLKINPRDVVSIPKDYHATKGRCSEYQVIAELPLPEDFDVLENRWDSVYSAPDNVDILPALKDGDS